VDKPKSKQLLDKLLEDGKKPGMMKANAMGKGLAQELG